MRACIKEDEEVDDNILNVNKSKLHVLYAQLDYYKNVVLKNRKCRMEFFTKDGVLLSVDVMIAKLKGVINFIVLPDDNTSSIKPKLKPVNERDNLMEERKSKLKDTILN